MWASHRGATLKCTSRHVVAALPEELVPWHDLVGAAIRHARMHGPMVVCAPIEVGQVYQGRGLEVHGLVRDDGYMWRACKLALELL